jgi:hypothetical protein
MEGGSSGDRWPVLLRHNLEQMRDNGGATRRGWQWLQAAWQVAGSVSVFWCGCRWE